MTGAAPHPLRTAVGQEPDTARIRTADAAEDAASARPSQAGCGAACGAQGADSAARSAASAGEFRVADTTLRDSTAERMPARAREEWLSQRWRPQREAIYRDVVPAEFYGAASAAVPPQPWRPSAEATIGDAPLYRGGLLALAAAYAFFAVRHRDDIARLFGRVRRSAVRMRDPNEESSGSDFNRFLTVAALLGIGFAGVVAVRYGAAVAAWTDGLPQEFAPLLGRGFAPLLHLGVAALCLAVAAYQFAALHAAGAATLARPFVVQLLRLKHTYCSFGAVVVSPALLLSALAPQGWGDAWLGLAAAGSVATAALCVRETLHLFLGKKISILYWFLYLCTVEVFPVSLLYLLAAR